MFSGMQVARRLTFDRTGDESGWRSHENSGPSRRDIPPHHSTIMSLHKSPSLKNYAQASIATLFFALISMAQADQCPITNAIKWIQYPDRAGLDVLAAQPPAGAAGQPLILASDFRCTQTGPITDIHLWASWLGDKP